MVSNCTLHMNPLCSALVNLTRILSVGHFPWIFPLPDIFPPVFAGSGYSMRASIQMMMIHMLSQDFPCISNIPLTTTESLIIPLIFGIRKGPNFLREFAAEIQHSLHTRRSCSRQYCTEFIRCGLKRRQWREDWLLYTRVSSPKK